MYIVTNKVKRKAKDLGFRTNEGFLHQLDVAVCILIERAIEWSKPKKTLDGTGLAAYMERHKIK